MSKVRELLKQTCREMIYKIYFFADLYVLIEVSVFFVIVCNKMPYNCSVESCSNYYTTDGKLSFYRLPSDPDSQNQWTQVIPGFQRKAEIKNFRICSQHWPEGTYMEKVRGGSLRPVAPPSVFNVPKSCVPTSKPTPRKVRPGFCNVAVFDQRDKFSSFSEFDPLKELRKKYKHFLYFSSTEKVQCVFLSADETESDFIITVCNEKTLVHPAIFVAFKKGVKVPVSKNILGPRNGFGRYSQFFEALNFVKQWKVPAKSVLLKMSNELRGPK